MRDVYLILARVEAGEAVADHIAARGHLLVLVSVVATRVSLRSGTRKGTPACQA